MTPGMFGIQKKKKKAAIIGYYSNTYQIIGNVAWAQEAN